MLKYRNEQRDYKDLFHSLLYVMLHFSSAFNSCICGGQRICMKTATHQFQPGHVMQHHKKKKQYVQTLSPQEASKHTVHKNRRQICCKLRQQLVSGGLLSFCQGEGKQLLQLLTQTSFKTNGTATIYNQTCYLLCVTHITLLQACNIVYIIFQASC